MPSRVSNLEAYVETLRKQSRIDMYDTNAFADLRGHIVEFPRHTQSIIKKNAAQIRRFALQANDWERHNFGISYSFFLLTISGKLSMLMRPDGSGGCSLDCV